MPQMPKKQMNTMLQSLLAQPEVEPVAYRFTQNRGNGKTAFTYHDNSEANNWRTAYRDNCLTIDKLYLHPPATMQMLSIEEAGATYHAWINLPEADDTCLEDVIQKAFCAKNGLTLEGVK